MNFPLAASNSQSATLAPFWADVDTRASGRVVYIAVTRSENISLTSAIDSTVTSSLAKLEDFTTSWALIVTWDHVGYYSSNRDKVGMYNSYRLTIYIYLLAHPAGKHSCYDFSLITSCPANQ